MTRSNYTLIIALALAGTRFSGAFDARAQELTGSNPRNGLNRPAAAPLQTATVVAEPNAISLFREGPERTGSISGVIALEHPKVLWTFRMNRDPGEPLLTDGVVYVGDRGNMLHAVRVKGGTNLWSARGVGDVYSSPARRGETIYVASEYGLSALSRSNGKSLWNCLLPGTATESSPLIAKDRIIVGNTRGAITAVGFDGSIIWQYDVLSDEREKRDSEERARGGSAGARPRTAASDGKVVYQPIFDQSRVIAIDLKAGKRRWAFQAKGGIYGEPAVTDDNVFFGSQDNQLYCLDKLKKTALWSFPTKSRIEAGVAFKNGSVFCASCDGSVYRVNAETGKEVWSYQTPRSDASTAIYSAPVCTDEAVYFGSFDGHLYCLKIDDGSLMWRFAPIPGSEITGSPQTDGRRIVLALRRDSKGRGENAIVIIGDDASDP